MNTQALKKCLLELDKESPNLAYIKGILETVVDMNEPVVHIVSQWQTQPNIPYTLSTTDTGISNPVEELSDEEREQEELAQRYSGGAIADLQ